MASSLGLKIIDEQEDWKQFVIKEFGLEARLFYISPLDSDRRLYKAGQRIIKIRRIHEDRDAQTRRQFGQDLQNEFIVLQYLEQQQYRNFSPQFSKSTEWEWLAFNETDGSAFGKRWAEAGLFKRLKMLRNTIKAIRTLNKLNIVHGDIVSNNLIVGEDDAIHFVDFGNAIIYDNQHSSRKEWRHLIFGHHGLLNRYSRYLVLAVLPGAQRVYRHIKVRRVSQFNVGQVLTPDEGLLEEAWRQASRWHTGEGTWMAYASLTVAGKHYPGQRPWLLRWNNVAERVSFRGKRVLDLGSNIGLFGSFTMLCGASEYLGIEREPSLVGAAKKIAQAFGVGPKFEVADLDQVLSSDKLRFEGWDIVIAMSIVEWVNNKDDLFAVLKSAKEVLYEGHDSIDIEFQRLHGAGFADIAIVTISEEQRPILYATRTGEKPPRMLESTANKVS